MLYLKSSRQSDASLRTGLVGVRGLAVAAKSLAAKKNDYSLTCIEILVDHLQQNRQLTASLRHLQQKLL